ncbi:Wzz/FepE/Etk N-terminal domain-containing protein [Hydrogenimonas sp. SS33]|uniref:Wzz/FepE/Etk N-terminal domain-containing protein n=1 Tax=Hydrogenimonas leucolamina TaxID=2954236 RepID=UPI00336C1251
MNEKKKASQNEPQVVIPYGYMPYCQPEEDEIDLRELWNIIKKRKKTVWWTTGVVFLAALVYILFATAQYEAKATLKIGSQLVKMEDGSMQVIPFDGAINLKNYVDVKYDTTGKYREKNQTDYIDNVSVPKKSNLFINISALGRNNKEAVETLSVALNDILEKHRQYYNSIRERRKDEIETKKEQIAYYLKNELPKLKKNLDLVKSVELKKINEKINLLKSIDIKKVENRINFLLNQRIPALKEKIKASRTEIDNKKKSIERMMSRLNDAAKNDPALATMTAMQIANLQNDISRLKLRIIDYESEIRKIEEEIIPSLKNEKVRLIKQRLTDLEAEKRRILEVRIPEIEAKIEKLPKMIIPNLRNEIKQTELSMKPPYLVMTSIVGHIYTHDYPVKPKKKLVLAVALITGLMLGLFLAFFKEFLSKEPEHVS